MEARKVPENEIQESFSRSGGPGGQNINKTSTKVELRWRVDSSSAFNAEEKTRIKEWLYSRMNSAGELLVVSQEERSQAQNRERAVEKLNTLVTEALLPEKERVATRPTRGAKEKRLKKKREQSEKRQSRSWRADE